MLLLTGRADAASTARARGRWRDAAEQPCSIGHAAPVTLRGAGRARRRRWPWPAARLLVTATPDDAAGYAQPWDPALEARPAHAPPGVAAYWTALLQDYLALFASGQRPGRLLELSPRGKVLLDLYAEAARASGRRRGVPRPLVTPLLDRWPKAFREIALLPPAGPASRAGAGAWPARWDGTMEERWPSRSRRVRLRSKEEAGRAR